MSKNEFLKQIEVKNPCSQDWDKMTGNDEVRFCSHCSLDVTNLSALTRKQALKIVRQSNGRICVRYVQNPVDKTPVFADKIYQITRRAGIAAGILGASLSLSSLTYAQALRSEVNNEEAEVSRAERSDEEKTRLPTATISGTIIDSQGNFAAGANVILTNLKTEEIRNADTDSLGFYEFDNVSTGLYKLSVEDKKGNAQVESLEILNASENRQDLALNVPVIAEMAIEQTDKIEFIEMGGAIAITVSYDNPLSMAVTNEDSDEVTNLISNGANVNGKEKDSKNMTPLFFAVENGNAEIAETLLNFGAKVNARDDEKRTPLMSLDDEATIELVRLLIKHGAKINLVDNEGNSALIFAAENARPEVLQELIKHGANVNAQNKQGETALMKAAYEDNLEKVKMLVLAGADVNLKNKENATAWDEAGNAEVKQLLESYGAKSGEN